ncbi:Histidine triad nucleotide-binding protein 3 [Sarracenia purpurea var. burkii]
MEARRRLALLSSHLRPSVVSPISTLPEKPTPKRFSPVSASNCASSLNGLKGNQEESDCVFCKIIRGESPALKLYEDDVCLCILDTNPVSHGHSLIIPKSHFSCLQATPPLVVGAMCSKVPFISNAVVKATGCDSFNLLVNNGAAAGQVIFHTHLHIIPRKTRDCLWASESLPRRPLKLDQETSQFVDQIRKELSFSGNAEDDVGQGSSLSTN